jgi:penicillin-binding protein
VVPLNQREVPFVLRRRLNVALGAGLLGFLLLLARLWDLQILRGEEMRTLSENNRIRLNRVQATRGTVVDRYGRVLVDSRPSFDAVLVPEDARNVELTIENLAQFLGQSTADMHALVAQTAARPPFAQLIVKRDLSREEVVALETHQLDLPGVSLQITPRRSYPLGPRLAHLLGYVGEASPQDLAADSRNRMGDLVGKTGLEKRWESNLRGVDGGQQIEVDALGRKLRVLREVEEVPGNTVKLTIDLDLQNVAARRAPRRMARPAAGQTPAAEQSRGARAVPAGIDVQSRRRHRRARGRDHQPLHPHPLPRRPAVRQSLLPLLEEGGPRLGESARSNRAVVRRVLLSGGAAPRHRSDRQVRPRLRPGYADGDRSGARKAGDDSGHGVEAPAIQAALVCRGNPLSGNRAGIRDGDTAADGQHDRDRRRR